MKRRRVVELLVVGCLVPVCGGRPDRREPTAFLAGDVARAGGFVLPGALVAEVSRARGISPTRAVDALVEDALLARAAVVEGLDRSPDVAWASTAAVARLVPRKLLEAARSRGPATDDELATLTVVHAVVERSGSLPESRALTIADALERAGAAATSPADFQARVNAVPHPSAVVVVETVASFDAAGRMPNGAQLDPAFVAAAFALARSGDTSPVVETSFGWHVIRLVDRVAPDRDVLDRRRSDLLDAVTQMRARAELQRVLRDRRRVVSVDVAAGADELTALAARGL